MKTVAASNSRWCHQHHGPGHHSDDGQTWLDRLRWLTIRLPGHGIGPDLASMSMAELWGVYVSLTAKNKAS